jgi:hypothetical protein
MAQRPSLLGPEATGLARLVWLEHGQAWHWSALTWLDMAGALAWPQHGMADDESAVAEALP